MALKDLIMMSSNVDYMVVANLVTKAALHAAFKGGTYIFHVEGHRHITEKMNGLMKEVARWSKVLIMIWWVPGVCI